MTLQNSGTEGTQIDAYTLKWTVVIELAQRVDDALRFDCCKMDSAQSSLQLRHVEWLTFTSQLFAEHSYSCQSPFYLVDNAGHAKRFRFGTSRMPVSHDRVLASLYSMIRFTELHRCSTSASKSQQASRAERTRTRAIRPQRFFSGALRPIARPSHDGVGISMSLCI